MIASRIGGIPELIEDGRTGFLFTPGDHRELAERLNCLMRDEQVRNRMSREARLTAVERFSAAVQIEHHLALYRDGAT